MPHFHQIFSTKWYRSFCQLTKLPQELTNIENLSDLNLSNNQLTELPWNFGKIRKLSRLNVAYNQLTDLPLSIGFCSALAKGININGNPIGKTNLIAKCNSSASSEITDQFALGPEQLFSFLCKVTQST